MSYNVNTPCGNCKKCQTTTETEGKCKDAQKIQDAVNKIHSKTFEQGHQGCGSIVLMCCRMEPKS